MAILNQKERILDIVLTDKGRELMSKNLLDFTYFAFSDEGVDYSGSLATTNDLSSSFDEHVHRGLMFEATQKKNGKGLPTNRDLDSFLYTIPSRKKVLPKMNVNRPEDEEITLHRRYLIDQLLLQTRSVNRFRSPMGHLLRATIPKKTYASRVMGYASAQRYMRTRAALADGRNAIGLSLGPNLLALNSYRALDIKTGATFPTSKVLPVDPDTSALSFKREIEVIMGVDEKMITFDLRDDEGRVFPSNGFLIEVFESGSDGKLNKLGRDRIENPINDDVIEEGFDSFLVLKAR